MDTKAIEENTDNPFRPYVGLRFDELRECLDEEQALRDATPKKVAALLGNGFLTFFPMIMCLSVAFEAAFLADMSSKPLGVSWYQFVYPLDESAVVAHNAVLALFYVCVSILVGGTAARLAVRLMIGRPNAMRKALAEYDALVVTLNEEIAQTQGVLSSGIASAEQLRDGLAGRLEMRRREVDHAIVREFVPVASAFVRDWRCQVEYRRLSHVLASFEAAVAKGRQAQQGNLLAERPGYRPTQDVTADVVVLLSREELGEKYGFSHVETEDVDGPAGIARKR